MSGDDLRYCAHEGEYSWWENDARGIPLAKVCDKCRKAKLAGYRPEVLTDPGYAADEPIEPEPPEWDTIYWRST